MDRPATQYARSGDVHIAYQVVGSGPMDLVVVPGFTSHLELYWDLPAWVACFERLASFSRLILFDKRGTGMSDRVTVATLEERMDDVRAVMDAVGSQKAAFLGISEGGPMSLLFAGTYPERIRALVLYAAFARRLSSPDYPFGVNVADRQAYVDMIQRQWGDEADLSLVAPSLVHDPAARARFARFRRLSASPGAAMALARMNSEIDVRHVLSAIHVPTLILHRIGDRDVTVENGRYLAAHIPGSRYVEFDDGDHLIVTGDLNALLGEVEEFLTGVRHGPELDRILTTVLFTDIAGSTQRAVALGDHRWRQLKSQHHAVVRRELERFRGREIDDAGDGFLATFDGPARAIRCAMAIRDGVRALGIDVRAGLHTGEVEMQQGKIAGVAVHIGARVMALAQPGQVLVSSTVKDLVAGAGLHFDAGTAYALKGVPGEWRLFAVDATG
jgi:class 3 adenylate cyclase